MGEGSEKVDLERRSELIAPFARRVAEAARLYSSRAPSAWFLDSVSSGSVARSERHKTLELADEESWPSDESDELDEVPRDERLRLRPMLVLDFGRAASSTEVERCCQFCRLPQELLPPPATARPDKRPVCRFPSVGDVPAVQSEREPEPDVSSWLQTARDLYSAGLPPLALSAAAPCQPCGFRSAVLCALAARQRPRRAPPAPARPAPARMPARKEVSRPQTPPPPLPPPPPPPASAPAAAQELVLRAAAAVRRHGCPSKAQSSNTQRQGQARSLPGLTIVPSFP